MGPDGDIWAATEAGASRIAEVNGAVRLTTFAALDGLTLPVYNIAVDTAGTVWLATAGGLFRLLPQEGTVAPQGFPQRAAPRPPPPGSP